MPRHDAEARGNGSVDLGIVLPGLLLLAALISRHPVAAERLWTRLGTYPDVVACRAAVDGASWPLRAWAGALLDRAEASAWHARSAGTHEHEVSSFVKAHGLAVGSRLVVDLPGFLLLAVGGLALGRLVRRLEAPPSIDLSERLVLLETSNLGPRTFDLPELELPFPPATASKEGWTDLEREAYEKLRDVVAREGVRAPAVSRDLATLPLGSASRLRRALRTEAGLSDVDLEAFRSGCLWRPRHWRLRRLRRARIPASFLAAREELRRIGGLTPLRERLLRIGAAHADWPASIDHHGAEAGGLLAHRTGVLVETIAMIRRGSVHSADREAVLTVAAAHDGGKWISFGYEGGRWVRYDGLHAEHTADILRSLPELHAEHGEDAERIVLALEHEYTPDSLPEDFAAACRKVMRPIEQVERVVVPGEETSGAALDRAVEEAIGVLPRIVSEMSINKLTGEWQAHGFYEGKTERGDEVLLILESALRHQLRDYLGQTAQRALGLWRVRRAGEMHPGFAALASALLAAGAIPAEVRGVPLTPSMPLVSLSAGKKVFRGAFPLDLEWLARRMEAESLVHLKDAWGSRGW
ncbi:MAG: hypothetical protein U0166_20995, partial [Acidobacteriota bacterium]